jgi:hypothetical protein
MKQFEELAQPRSRPTFIADLFYFLRHSKKWWMLPILVVLLLFGTLMLLSGTAAAPFIYTLF